MGQGRPLLFPRRTALSACCRQSPTQTSLLTVHFDHTVKQKPHGPVWGLSCDSAALPSPLATQGLETVHDPPSCHHQTQGSRFGRGQPEGRDRRAYAVSDVIPGCDRHGAGGDKDAPGARSCGQRDVHAARLKFVPVARVARDVGKMVVGQLRRQRPLRPESHRQTSPSRACTAFGEVAAPRPPGCPCPWEAAAWCRPLKPAHASRVVATGRLPRPRRPTAQCPTAA